MSKLAVEMLHYIATRLNHPSELARTINIAINPSKFKRYHNETLLTRKDAHNYLKLLAQEGNWIELRFTRIAFGDNELLDRIVINDSMLLLDHLNIKPEYIVVNAAIQQITNADLILPSRLSMVMDEVAHNWRNGKAYQRCKASDVSKLIDSLKVIEWLEVNPDRAGEIDYRTLSVRLFSDSKKIEQLISIVANLLRASSPSSLQGEAATTILAYWGVSRYTPSFKIKGPILLQTQKGTVDFTAAWPFIEIPPDGIIDIGIKSPPSYVLFIENKTTFERYTREIDDDGLIIYTNGFPSRQWQIIIKRISSLINSDTSFYHWGDIDLGGFEIFRFIAGLIDRNLVPHMMKQLNPSKHNEGVSVIRLLSVLDGMTIPGALELIVALNSIGGDVEFIEWVEQESLPICPP